MSGGGFMRGTKFRYTGRTEREILTESLNILRQQHLLNNTSPSKRKANSVPATPSSPQGDLAEIRKIFFSIHKIVKNIKEIWLILIDRLLQLTKINDVRANGMF